MNSDPSPSAIRFTSHSKPKKSLFLFLMMMDFNFEPYVYTFTIYTYQLSDNDGYIQILNNAQSISFPENSNGLITFLYIYNQVQTI